MSLPYLGAIGAHKRALIAITAIAAISAVVLLLASAAFLQPAAVAPKGGTAEGLGLKGIVEITVRDASGNVKYHEVLENAVTRQGLVNLLKYGFKSGAASSDLFAQIRFLNAKLGTTEGDTGSLTASDLAAKEVGPLASMSISDPVWDSTAGKAKVVLTAGPWSPSTATTIYSIVITDHAGSPASAIDPSTTVYVFAERYVTIGVTTTDSITITWTVYAGPG